MQKKIWAVRSRFVEFVVQQKLVLKRAFTGRFNVVVRTIHLVKGHCNSLGYKLTARLFLNLASWGKIAAKYEMRTADSGHWTHRGAQLLRSNKHEL